MIGTTAVDVPAVRVDRRAPVVIASPLRGTGWLNANGCCKDPTSPHRNTVLATSDGRYVTPEMFAVDWVRVVSGRLHTGDGSKNGDWPTFGAPLYAVANGTVVSAVDNRPDIPPSSQNPDLRTPRDFGGNRVFLRIGPGRYACYAHMQSGSVRVRRGQRVRVGHGSVWSEIAGTRPVRICISGSSADRTAYPRANRSRSTGTRWRGTSIWRRVFAHQRHRSVTPRASFAPAHRVVSTLLPPDRPPR
ncbi:MAG: hypothetical protein ACXVQR_00755 [Solirubrobacteraceae bacterium]